MDVYQAPREIKYPSIDWANDDSDKITMMEDAHSAELKQWLIKQGFTGDYTGEIYRSQIADGYAQYMFAQGGNGSCLIHLEYCDAYEDGDVSFIPEDVIIERIDSQKKFAKMFS